MFYLINYKNNHFYYTTNLSPLLTHFFHFVSTEQMQFDIKFSFIHSLNFHSRVIFDISRHPSLSLLEYL